MLLASAASLFISLNVFAKQSDEIVAVYASVSPDYHRTVLPGGTFKPEFYAFGEGGDQGGGQNDFTIDRLRFTDIAHLIAPALAAKKYVPCSTADPSQPELLIMVYWGTTIGTEGTSSSPEYQIAQSLTPGPLAPLSPAPNGLGGTAMVSDPSSSGRASEGQSLAAIQAANDSALTQSISISGMANRQRDQRNRENAALLGFLPELKRVDHFRMSSFAQRRQDVIEEIAESRYYVVLLAYDFQELLKHKQRKLLWETRFSIPERRNRFDEQLAAMAATASRYFGEASEGLKRNSLREGHINLGELEIIRVEPESK